MSSYIIYERVYVYSDKGHIRVYKEVNVRKNVIINIGDDILEDDLGYGIRNLFFVLEDIYYIEVYYLFKEVDKKGNFKVVEIEVFDVKDCKDVVVYDILIKNT